MNVGDRVKVKDNMPFNYEYLIGMTGTVESIEPAALHFAYPTIAVLLDVDKSGIAMRFYEQELALLSIDSIG